MLMLHVPTVFAPPDVQLVLEQHDVAVVAMHPDPHDVKPVEHAYVHAWVVAPQVPVMLAGAVAAQSVAVQHALFAMHAPLHVLNPVEHG